MNTAWMRWKNRSKPTRTSHAVCLELMVTACGHDVPLDAERTTAHSEYSCRHCLRAMRYKQGPPPWRVLGENMTP